MKNKLKYLDAYLPWLFILLGFDMFTVILLWLSDIRIFQALSVLLILTTIVLFSILSTVLVGKEIKKINGYKVFLSYPEKNTELELLRLCSESEKECIKEMASAFYEKQMDIERGKSLLSEYEEYVEMWAHEIKLPLSLLFLVLDNQNENLPKDVAFKLDYVRNQIQSNVSQILFYHRIKSDKKDFLFEDVDLQESICDVLESFKPLLEEKNFKVELNCIHGISYTDRRSFEFIISQLISNAAKYSTENPELNISMKKCDEKNVIVIRDNGCGVKACDLPHLFEKGFTGDSGNTRKKSTGMGLYLVKQLADALKIDIEVRSDWTKGFEINLYL